MANPEHLDPAVHQEIPEPLGRGLAGGAMLPPELGPELLDPLAERGLRFTLHPIRLITIKAVEMCPVGELYSGLLDRRFQGRFLVETVALFVVLASAQQAELPPTIDGLRSNPQHLRHLLLGQHAGCAQSIVTTS